MAPSYRAIESICHGQGDIRPGEIIPATDTDLFGNESPVDFDRLVQLGAAELVGAAKATDTSDDPSAPDDAHAAPKRKRAAAAEPA
jgi:hypothetical protein